VKRRICGAKEANGLPCQRAPKAGFLRCSRHGGVPNIGRHLSEDAHHSRSLAKANARKWLVPHHNNGTPGGQARAATARRLRNGRFAANRAPLPKRAKLVAKATSAIITATGKSAPARPAPTAPVDRDREEIRAIIDELFRKIDLE
jgi:hypothetical protein